MYLKKNEKQQQPGS